jgi:homoserine O-acetyltransferase
VVLPKARIAYATFGTLNANKSNVVLAPSWYGSDHHGYDFLLAPGAALDPARYFVVATEMFANGFSSSPSNTPAPFDGPRFPAVAIRDNVEAARRLLQSELGSPRRRHRLLDGAQQAFSGPCRIRCRRASCLLRDRESYPHGQVRLEYHRRAHR